jgi:hypothetical protein
LDIFEGLLKDEEAILISDGDTNHLGSVHQCIIELLIVPCDYAGR